MPTLNVFDVFDNNLQTVILATWPEVDVKVFQDIQIERRDWVNMLDDDKLTVPWCVIEYAEESTDEWGAQPHLLMKPTIFYITSQTAAVDAGATSMLRFIRGKIQSLRDAVLDPSAGLGTIDPALITVDTTANNPANASFLANKNSTYQAGSIQIVCVMPAGFTATV